MIEDGMPKCRTEQDVIILWENAGMKNANEYFYSVKAQMQTYAKIYNNPEVKKWSSEAKALHLGKMLDANKNNRHFE